MRRFYKSKILLILAGILMVITPWSLSAQSVTGAIAGTVTDATNAVISEAVVTVTNQATGVSRSLKTDAVGFYSVEGLMVGQYSVDVTRDGFEENLTKGIQIDPGTRRENNVILKVGASTTKVTVEADQVAVNTESSETGGTISAEQIDNMQLNGRSFESLAVAIPGVASTAGADAQSGTESTLIVNGSGADQTTFFIDGVWDDEIGNLGYINLLPVVDGISEFTVLTGNYSAKYGLASTGEVLVETKSGTATFHGTAWDYLRNNAFDAVNYFATSAPPLRQNIYGYTFGGPLTIPGIYNTDRKRTFFFASNQWIDTVNSGITRGSTFTQAMRTGDFSSSPTLPTDQNGNVVPLSLDAHSQALLAAEGKTNCITGATTLNTACFDEAAVGIMNGYYPLPNNPSGGFLNYINLQAQSLSQLDYQFRVDHYITPKHELTARVMYEPVLNKYPYNLWTGSPFPTLEERVYPVGFNGLIRLQSTLTPNLLNTLSFADTYYHQHLDPAGQDTLPAGVTIQQAFPNAPNLNLVPTISIAGGWSGNGVGPQPIIADDGEAQVFDDVSWVRGKHVLQAGAVFLSGIKKQNDFLTPQGSFSFSGTHTGDPAADYMLGLDSGYSQNNTVRFGIFHYKQGEAYVQDDWKATDRLTLNLGLRWQYFSNDTASGDQATSFNPALYNAAQAPAVTPTGALVVNAQNQPLTTTGEVANLTNGLAFAGQNGVSSGFFTPKKTNFAPRVGFAYKAFPSGKTSIRGGYGIGYTRVPIAQIYAAYANTPYVQTANILNSLLSNGTAGGLAAAPTTQGLTNVPFSFTPTNIQSYSLTVQQEVRPNMVAMIAYVGSQGRHLAIGGGGGIDENFPLPVTAATVPTTGNHGCLAPGQLASTSYDFDPCINSGSSSPDYTRPYQGYTTMSSVYDEGSSNYNSFQSSLTYRAGGSQFNLAYTYGKSLATVGPRYSGGTNATTSSGAQNPRDVQKEYGPPDYDFRQDFAATWLYSIPYFKKSARPVAYALGNWSFAGLALFQSGFALSPGINTGTEGEASRPNQVASVHTEGKESQWFNTSAFTAPNYGFFGNAANGTIRGPGDAAFNVSLLKTFPIVERLSAQFRAEAFNVFNHPSFSNVDTGLGDGSFGQATSAHDPRILEFALKLIY